MTCVKGSVLDVIVDIRVGSPTFGQWTSVLLDDRDRRAVYLSEGLGHGFCSLEDGSTVVYLCSEGYNPTGEHEVHPLDPAIGIEWPLDGVEPELSAKDAAAPTLAEAAAAGLLAGLGGVRRLPRGPGVTTDPSEESPRVIGGRPCLRRRAAPRGLRPVAAGIDSRWLSTSSSSTTRRQPRRSQPSRGSPQSASSGRAGTPGSPAGATSGAKHATRSDPRLRELGRRGRRRLRGRTRRRHLRIPTLGLVCASVRLADSPEVVNAVGNPVHFLYFSWAGGFGDPADQHAEPGTVASITGATFAVRRDFWDQLGGFDERYFLYQEDVDLSMRTWLAGKQVRYVPTAIALHNYEFGRTDTKFYYLERNRLINLLTFPERRTLVRIAPLALGVEFALIATAAQGRLGQAEVHRLPLAGREPRVHQVPSPRHPGPTSPVRRRHGRVLSAHMDVPAGFGMTRPEVRRRRPGAASGEAASKPRRMRAHRAVESPADQAGGPQLAPHASRGSGSRPTAAHRSWPRTLYAGRGAGRGKASVVVGWTRSGSAPISR